MLICEKRGERVGHQARTPAQMISTTHLGGNMLLQLVEVARVEEFVVGCGEESHVFKEALSRKLDKSLAASNKRTSEQWFRKCCRAVAATNSMRMASTPVS